MSYFVLTWVFTLNINLRDMYMNSSAIRVWDCHIVVFYVLLHVLLYLSFPISITVMLVQINKNAM